MSVTVVSALNKPLSVSPTGNAPGKTAPEDGTAVGQDFVGLLLGQLVAAIPISPDASKPEVTTSTDDEPAEGSDGAALFAALGLVAQDGVRASDTLRPTETSPALPGIGQNDRAKADTAGPLPSVSVNQRPDLQSADDKSSAKTDTFSLVKPAVDDKSAIIAANVSTSPAATQRLATSDSTATRTVANEALTTPLPAATSRETTLSVATPVRDSAWSSELADKIVWLASNDKQSAKLTLNPAHMGPLEISLNIDKGHATASFVSASAEVRDALETALPRLREMFANAGISLGQTNVSAESFNQQAGNGANGADTRGAARWSADNAILADDLASSAVSMSLAAFASQRGNGMVDTFA